jgi:hypothetical protein
MKFSMILISCMLYSEVTFARKKNNDREEIKVKGIYKVTIEESTEELKIANNYPVTYKIRKLNGIIQKISYDLPAELTGAEVDVEFAPSAEDPTVWTGPHAESVCQLSDVAIRCAMKYRDLSFDPLMAETTINTSTEVGPVNNAKKDIMKHFQTFALGNEPIGHVDIKLP